MTGMLYRLMSYVSRIHEKILELNDAFEYNFSDKELHFIVIGLLGLGMVFVIYPIFSWLARKNHIMVITWIYVFTLIIVITFAIEIGQKITKSGTMEFGDIMFGVVGFLAMFGVFAIIRAIIRAIVKAVKK